MLAGPRQLDFLNGTMTIETTTATSTSTTGTTHLASTTSVATTVTTSTKCPNHTRIAIGVYYSYFSFIKKNLNFLN